MAVFLKQGQLWSWNYKMENLYNRTTNCLCKPTSEQQKMHSDDK